MANMDVLLDRYHAEHLRISRSDAQEAIRSRDWVLKRIKDEIAGRCGQATLFDEQNFVFGSYVKKTQITTSDEFDVFLIVDCNSGFFTSGGIQIGRGEGDDTPNHLFSQRYYFENGTQCVSPTKLLNWVKEVAESALSPWGVEAPVRDGCAVTITIKSQGICIDLVPGCRFIDQRAASYAQTFYCIPSGLRGGSDGWILTNPKADIERLRLCAQDRKGLRHLVRLMKKVKSSYNFGIPSIAVESAAISYAESTRWSEFASVEFPYIFGSFADKLQAQFVPDPYDPAKNLLDTAKPLGWYGDRVREVVRAFEEAKAMSDEDKAYQKITRALNNE